MRQRTSTTERNINSSRAAEIIGQIGSSVRLHKRTIGRAARIATPFIVIFALLIASAPFKNITLAYEVKCEGEPIGYVADAEAFTKAAKLASERVDDGEQLATTAEYNVALVSDELISDAEEISSKLVEKTERTTTGYGLYVDGSLTAASKNNKHINEALRDILKIYKKTLSASTAYFISDISVKPGSYTDKELCNGVKEVKARIKRDRVKVAAVVNQTTKKTIKYKTKTVASDAYYTGYKYQKTFGRNGIKSIIKKSVYINGVLQKAKSKKVEKLTQKATDVKIVKGVADSSLNIDGKAKYSFPVKQVSSCYVNVGFRGYAGHTGIDICAAKGTPIYAADAGTVVKVVHKTSSYGYYLIIRHSDTYRTLYAHCSYIAVKEGDKVRMGQYIGKVGRTGRATGNHLHFEVRKNGNAVDPAPYIGV